MLVVRCTTPLWWDEDTRCGESVGHPLGASVGEMVATQPRSGAAMIKFREHRQGEVLGIHLPRTLINSEEASCFSWACLAQRSSPSPDREGTSQGATRCAHRRPKERHNKEFPLGGFTSETANASSTVEWGAAIQLRMMTHHLAEAYSINSAIAKRRPIRRPAHFERMLRWIATPTGSICCGCSLVT